MSGFEALSMVCSIMQVISFTKEVLALCKDVYHGRPTADSRMEENTASIKALLDEMNHLSGSINKQSKDEKELYKIAQRCSKAAEELQKEIQHATKHHKPGQVIAAMISGLKSKIHERKIAGLHHQVSQYQKTLETHILVRLCTKSDAIGLQRRQDFTELSNTMKYFISQLAAGHTETANLIDRYSVQTRQQIQQSEARMRQSINYIHDHTNKESEKANLLRSLKYESMNSRRTELKPAHEATYVLIFESLEVDENLGDELSGRSDKLPISTSAFAWKSFVQWLQSDKRMFWIQGKPGSGKSTLMKGVNKWKPNTLIISHFFWKLGDILQKNLRGLLCSLIHQLLSSDHDLIGHVLSNFVLVPPKDTVGDWENAELESIFHFILTRYKRSVLFLIDGLDEASGIEEVFQFLDSFIGLRNIKQKFSTYDGFKLNELTENDMLQLVLAGIPETDGRYPSDFLQNLRHLLVTKAEGVYLWLIIALESVRRGIRNNDEQYEIHLRLSRLPSKLEELYADMWSRLGEDKQIYQKEATRYFNLLMTNHSFLEQYNKAQNPPDDQHFEWHLSPFQLMLTTNENIKENMLDRSYHPSISDISQRCEYTVKSLSVKTAGLLIPTQSHYIHSYNSMESMEAKEEFSELSEHLTVNIDFIHRTLFDFFKESETGKTILAQSQTHRTDVELATVLLCQLRTMQHAQRLTKLPIRMSYGTPLQYFRWVLAQLLAEGSALENLAIMNLLYASDDLFEAGLLPWDNRPEWHPHPSSDLLLIGNPVFKDIIQSRVERKGAPHATCLLREYLLARADSSDIYQHIFSREESILSLGGDINSDGICLYNSPTPMFYDSIFPWTNVTPEFATYESILSLVIKRLHMDALLSDAIQHECMQDLVAALEREPDLNKHTSFVVGMQCLNGFSYTIEARLTQLADLLYTMVSTGQTHEEEILRQVSLDTETYDAFIIMKVNLKYLVEQLFELLPPYYINKERHLVNRARQLCRIDNCKPYAKALFFIQLDLRHSSMACYRFMNQNFDFLADSTIKIEGSIPRRIRTVTPTQIDHYLAECERVDMSTLSVLADERLGVCRLEDMGIKPPVDDW
ncbi:hypothetical protein J3F84DRAFT_396552 [Trichoderma pleuroticola]